ncbi:MAG: outer rane receptor protein [Hydrocarboniphaga sp.]|nr:outer rane receptor protein [Hydrocarboniphaga sp.]
MESSSSDAPAQTSDPTAVGAAAPTPSDTQQLETSTAAGGAQEGSADGVPATVPEASSEAAVDAAAPTEAEPEAEATAGGSGVKNRMIEEVVVTAQKREQNLQEVASSVTAFSGTQLEAQGISDIKDMQLVTPGLTYDSMASYSIIFIRGIGGDAFQAAVDSSVATYIDGLYLPFTFSAAQALGDVAQVEVLKGPQGTLYGRNAIAGAILIKLKEPSNTFRADVLEQFGNYGDFKTKAAVSGPVPGVESLTYSLSGLYENRDAFTSNFVTPSSNYLPYRNIGFRGAIKWEPMDDLKVTASYYWLKNQDADSVATTLLKTAPLFAALLTDNTEAHKSGNEPNVGVHALTRVATLSAESHLIDWFDMKLVYGHTNALSNIAFDYDSAPEPVLDISALPNTARADSAELIFTSNPATAPDWLEWVGGLYYENSYKTGRYPATVDPLATTLGLIGSAQFGGKSPLCGFLEGLGLDCNANPNTNQNPLVVLPIISGIQTYSYSAYGQLTFKLNDDLSAIAGTRITTEERDLKYSGVQAQIDDAPIDIGTIDAIVYNPQQHTWNSLTPNLGVNYKLTDDILLYYKYSEAFKSGNYNGLNINNPPTRVEPETAKSHEIGYKTELFDDRSLKFNGAFFQTQVENAQVQTLALTSGGVTNLVNAGKYTVRGTEVELNWFATESLVFSATGVYLHGRYDEFIGKGFDDTLYLYTQHDFKGNDTVRTPKWSGTLAGSYSFPLGFWGLEGDVGSDVYYNDGFYYDPLNTLTQKSYYILNARLGVNDPAHNVRVSLFGKNLTDEVFFTQKYRQDFGDTGIYGAARTYGLTVTWNYGS